MGVLAQSQSQFLLASRLPVLTDIVLYDTDVHAGHREYNIPEAPESVIRAASAVSPPDGLPSLLGTTYLFSAPGIIPRRILRVQSANFAYYPMVVRYSPAASSASGVW